jgi:cytoskeletal protein CcmA (bactofilin family)
MMNLPQKRHFKGHVRLIVIVLLVCLAALLIAQSVFAEDNIYTGTIPASKVIENDIIITGNNVEVNGTVLGDVFAGGRTVTINGEIEGSLVAVGETVTVNGPVGGSVYSAAVTLEIGSDANIGRSVYFLAVRLVLAAGSQIQRDLVGLALGAELASSPDRDQTVVIGLIELVLRILDRFNIETGELALLPKAIAYNGDSNDFMGKLVYAGGGATSSGLIRSDAGPITLASFQEDGEEVEPDDEAGVDKWFLARLRELVTFLVIGGLTAWWFPSAFSRWALYLRARPLASAGYGIVAWATGVFGHILIGILILIIGIGLFVATLGALALAFLGVAVPSLWLAFSIFLIFILFLSKVIVSYHVGVLILERIAPKVAARKFWPMLLGLLIYVPLRSIPFFGLALSLVVTLLGLGAVWLAHTTRTEQSLYLDAMSDEAE